jgi:hypothetical protein
LKKRIKQSLLVGGAVVTVGLASLGSAGLVSAATTNSGSSDNPQSSLVEKLVSRFNLNKDDVQKVFDEDRAEHEAQHEAQLKDQLDALVTSGKITQAQEDKLIAKAKELKAAREADREAMKDKTDTERKAAMDAKRDSFEKWLSDNGIAEEYGRLIMRDGYGPGEPGRALLSDSTTNN